MSRTGFFAAMRCTARTWSEGVIGLATLTVIATEWPFPASAGTSSLTRPGRTGIPLVKDQTRGSVVLTCGLTASAASEPMKSRCFISRSKEMRPRPRSPGR